MRSITTAPLAFLCHLLLLAQPSLSNAPDAPKQPSKPCTLKSPLTGAYFDLNKISLVPPHELEEGQHAYRGEERGESWHARGYDYGANFTMNICAPVIENLNAVEGVDESNWKNISAYYTKDGKTYSIGQESQEPIFRGKRMVLNYTDGSPCPSSSTQRKSTLLSFLCDRDMAASAATVSYVGSMDECSYFFEVRSSAACGGVAAPAEGGLGPAGVFGIIALIAVAVYLLGGCAYQRTVMHQRGWRQLPNYTLWAGIASCFKDNLIIIIYTIAQAFHIDNCFSRVRDRVRRHADDGRGDYSGIFGRRGGGGRAGGGNSQRPDYDEENQFLDQLDEEWEE